MVFIYNIGIKLYNFILHVSQIFILKARLWTKGQKNLLQKIAGEVDSSKKHIWFHFASLGEFEQGRPVLERLKEQYPHLPVVITFFSPSGYEQKKNYALAKHVFYLPLDTAQNARRFIKLINPAVAVFTKYEYWYNFFSELKRAHTPLYIISGIFRPGQPFFKWYGGLHRHMLGLVSHFFVQDHDSARLLKSLDINDVTISGDTRFDRVAENALSPKKFPQVERFCNDSQVFVAGSTWPEDEKIIAPLVTDYPDWKYIIAPHEIKAEKIKALEEMLPESSVLRHSTLITLDNDAAIANARILIIDNIGMLSSLYQYGKIAYIGGGFGVGIHNTLEAAAFGVPVIFGPNYERFLEAKALIRNGGGYTINSGPELLNTMTQLQDTARRSQAGTAAGAYVEQQKGATSIIVKHIQEEFTF